MTTVACSESVEPIDPEVTARLRGTTFLFLWGMFALLHQAVSYDHWLTAKGLVVPLGWSVSLAALLLVIKPSSLGRFAGLLAATIALEWVQLPVVPNHIFFALSASATALAALAWGLFKGGRSAGRASLERALALIGLEVLLMYGWVTLHKLNYDYFNGDVSCAVSMYRQVGTWLRFMPAGRWVDAPTIVGVLLLEGLIPVLLAIPRTRVLGVGVGLVFHFLLALHPNRYVYSYSAMMFALFAVFLPGDFLADLRAIVKRVSIWRLAGLAVLGVLAAAGVLMTGLVIDRAKLASRLDGPAFIGIRLVWMVLGFTAMAIFAATLLGRSRAEGRRLVYGPHSLEPTCFRPALSWLLIFPVLVFFNGCCPYLGLKTQTAFAMFSNLRTEGGRTNHVFLPIRFRLADYQEDLVHILDSSDNFIRSLPGQGLCLTYFELRRMASEMTDPNFTVTYIRNGQRITASRNADPTAELFHPNPWLLNKLFYFRQVQIDSRPQRCMH